LKAGKKLGLYERERAHQTWILSWKNQTKSSSQAAIFFPLPIHATTLACITSQMATEERFLFLYYFLVENV